MSYSVKEIFYTLQGEGAHAGRPSVFLRFSGCNLWTGREQDRTTAACTFCDTDFIGTNGVGGGKFKTADLLAEAAFKQWPSDDESCGSGGGKPYIVCTGGEPLLQLDDALIDALHEKGFEIAIETNGTIEVPTKIDWICISPKAANTIIQNTGNELKLIFPQAEPEAHPDRFALLQFDHFFLQPLDAIGDIEASKENTLAAHDFCLKNPKWHLSVQTHKLVGFP